MKYVIEILNSYSFEKTLFPVLFFLLIELSVSYLLRKEFYNKWIVMSVKDLDYVTNQCSLFIMTTNRFRSTVGKKICQPSGKFYLRERSGVWQYIKREFA